MSVTREISFHPHRRILPVRFAGIRGVTPPAAGRNHAKKGGQARAAIM
ncbi:hypothetical protein AGRO_2017 [Agrobacterium sp. ATCC 31749]|nr:hypothetical protein AGRO_2017 [Agrobacterium sp. ATCC 31749]